MRAEAPFLVLALAAVFGLLIGSFLNVCIYRIPYDLSVVTPRSFCPACNTQIAWYDNIPILSFMWLRGRCRACGKPIGIRYPLVEASCAALFVYVVLKYGLTAAAVKWIIFEALLVALFWTDLEERILPDELTIGGTVIGLVFAAFVPLPGIFADVFATHSVPAVRSILNAAAGAIVLALPMWLLGVVYAKVRKREGLGFGDVKLLLMFGAFLGVEGGLLALLIGALAGSILGLLYVWWAKKSAATYELPFGSFLCAGAAIIPLINRL